MSNLEHLYHQHLKMQELIKEYDQLFKAFLCSAVLNGILILVLLSLIIK